jgi:GT2 family glycosyltransferase
VSAVRAVARTRDAPDAEPRPLPPGTVVRPAFVVDPAEPSRLLDREGRSVRTDAFARGLVASVGSETTLGELLELAPDPPLTYATVYVLALAGMLELDPASLSRPPVTGIDPIDTPPLVSVIVVNYNGARDLPRLLRSLRRQEYPELQTIVVDNDSSDGSLELLREAREGIEVVALPRNVGFAGGFNAGLRLARGAYVAVLNPDVELPPDALGAWVAKALQRPDAAAVAPKMMLRRHPRFLNSLGNSVLPGGWGSDNFIGVFDAGQFDHVEHVFSACFGAALLSREALDAVGRLDAGYFLYYEDADWCYRARRHGFSIVTAPECRVTHSFGASVGTASELFKLRLVARNRLRFALQNLSGGPLRKHLGSYVVSDLRAVSSAMLKRADYRTASAYLRAYAALVGEGPSLWRTRSNRQHRADEPDWTLNFAPNPPASIGDEPLVSAEVARHYYVPLFPLRLERAAALKSSK